MSHATTQAAPTRPMVRLCLAVILWMGLCCFGCNRSAKPTTNGTASQSKASDIATGDDANAISKTQPPKLSVPLFEELTPESTGVDFTQRLAEDHPLAYLYHSGYSCGGVCLGDVNGDGLSDIFIASGPDPNALFLNRGDLKFERVNVFGNADSNPWSVGASMTDVDGDGDLDLFVCNYDAPNMLWLNNGNAANGQVQFHDVAKSAGVDFVGPSQCPYFSDFDQDGDLDLFLLTNRLYSPTGRPSVVASELGPDGKVRIKEEFAKYFRVVQPALEVPPEDPKQKAPGPFMLELGHEDRLYRYDGKNDTGTTQFVDVTQSSGIQDVIGHGLSALVWDVNADGLPDIYVANDFSDPDKFWINQGADASGRFRFEDKTTDYVPYTAWSAMGSDIADVNGDGRFDFMVADMAATTHFKAKSTMGAMTGWRRWVLENAWPRQTMRNMLYIDSGTGRYKEAAYLAGVGKSDWTWSVKFADFDLDGRNDLYLTNGTARIFSNSDITIKPQMFVGQTEWNIFKDTPENRERNLAFRNAGDLEFNNVGQAWNLDKESMSYAAATGDLDNDGDLDLVVCNLEAPVSVYKNHATDTGSHWLRVKLDGEGQNRFGLGAVVTAALPGGQKLVRLMNPQTGFLSGNDSVLHFGLGSATKVNSLEIKWANGETQQLGEQDVDQLLTVQEQSNSTSQAVAQAKTDFQEVSEQIGLRFEHQEAPFNDYAREFLLPGKLSQFGPGVAVADVNADGLDDVFIGGAAGQAGVLFVHQEDHTFRPADTNPWLADASSEDMGILFFDADRDGDLDLYIAHGSNEFALRDRRYADRLYLNQPQANGEPKFAKCNDDALPKLFHSGSCVVGADYDRDGDVDLFIGSRSVPGRYPITPASSLLRNDGKTGGDVKFTDLTDIAAAGLKQCGLVTGAIWSDVDSDGWIDLLVTCEWGPVKLFINRKGTLEDVTKSQAFAEHPGWWNSIVGGDFDADGDIDFATTNVGLNTKYGRASNEKPAVLYRGDMDGNGQYDLVEAKSSKEGELPVRGRSCSCNAMPLLRKKFPTYKQFALSSLEGIYTDTGLENAERVAATEFESGVWINESTPGKPQFRWQPLPRDTQISPNFGAVAADFYGAQRPAIVMTQNHFTREPETGLWRGGLGVITTPTNNATFQTRPTSRSGFVISGDGKGLAIADLNGDHRPDLIATQNDSTAKAFRSNADNIQSPFAVHLQGLPGNLLAFGARVSMEHAGKTISSTEVYGGSGYLSQSSSTVFYAKPNATDELTIRVAWPNGTSSIATVAANETAIQVRQPTAK